ncbi:hypothetical protein Gasu2_55590 [Galdieria sulphuraria]|uniref:Uncharacterized protein n=1 Tax=Galdieria sulphuraria TaxID=130081 RepID=M2W0R2_GALSU|nr:uncharacterized protein Gasu_34030 [Galdieria sulphuraria]EME29201.1 hypothetical protein Gasu_34030 [Galdieria sulphuraria]GJD11420.1 hypothetical protein Gasu2_55590 [Galdieria sulphuraria]|eukprot:XP_005705721.1 hypothetical protein Gasu_34030 [Galdieria sulphuraria]
MQEIVKSRFQLLRLSSIQFLCSRYCFVLGLKTSSSSVVARQKKTASTSRRKRATKLKQQHTTKEMMDLPLSTEQEIGSVEETEPNGNQLCHLSEEMKGYVKWMQDGLLNEEIGTNQKQCDSGLSEQVDVAVSKERVDHRIYLSRWQELFQLPSARYQSLNDERLLMLNKSAPSMTRVLLLMENGFHK